MNNVLHIEGQHKFSVAPMMEYTDRHFRTLQRMMSRETVLYTEMVAASTIVKTVRDPMLYMDAGFSVEDPLVLQVSLSLSLLFTPVSFQLLVLLFIRKN